MAPRRGGGGGGGSSSVSSCPDAFLTSIEQASFANDVVFLVVVLSIAVFSCLFRKRKVAGKKLLGLPFIGALFFFILCYICSVIATVLQECRTTGYESYYDFRIAINIFSYLANYLLLVVVVHTLNSMLRRQLDHCNAVFKIFTLAIVGVLGVIMCVVVGLGAYLTHSNKTRLFYGSRSLTDEYFNIAEAYPKLQAAYYSLYLVAVIVGGAVAMMTILSLRRARKPAGDLIGWSIVLTVAMVFQVIISIVFVAWVLEGDAYYNVETTVALGWLLNLGQALSLIFILCIAKHESWRSHTVADPVGSQPQYTYNVNSNPQGYYYHQSPEYVGNGTNGNAAYKP